MSLILTVALGYVGGRLVAHMLAIVAKVVIQMILERSEGLQELVRQSTAKEARLKESLGGS